MNKVGAYILITVYAGKSHSVLKAIKEDTGAKFAHIVTGPYDLIAYMEADNSQNLANLVVNEIHNIPGIVRTMTCFTV